MSQTISWPFLVSFSPFPQWEHIANFPSFLKGIHTHTAQVFQPSTWVERETNQRDIFHFCSTHPSLGTLGYKLLHHLRVERLKVHVCRLHFGHTCDKQYSQIFRNPPDISSFISDLSTYHTCNNTKGTPNDNKI